jgi:parallel beta-helix repeat protein
LLGSLGAALLGFALFATPSEASHVSCGETITQDRTLDSDLQNCPGAGVVIGASGITLNLNGHTIDGTVPHGACGTLYGVDNSAGHDDVTVKDGTVKQFDDGIELIGASENRLSGLNVRGNNCDGVFISDGAHRNVVVNNRVSRNDFRGIVVRDSNRNRIARNALSANDHAGVAVFRSLRTQIERNSVAGNGRSQGGRAEFGVELVTSSNSLIRANTVVRHSQAGVVLFELSKRNRIERNSVRRYGGDGIILIDRSNENAITENTVAMSSGSDTFGGIEIFDSSANTLRRNTVADNGFGGIVIGAGSEEPARSRANVVAGNTACRNPDDGIRVGTDAVRTLIRRNLACQNGDDGIDVNQPNTSLGGNSANRNADLGIEATPGVTDLGGNRARRNGDPRQCTFVACG